MTSATVLDGNQRTSYATDVAGRLHGLKQVDRICIGTPSIAGFLSMKKWGAAFATFTLCYTLSTSVNILIY